MTRFLEPATAADGTSKAIGLTHIWVDGPQRARENASPYFRPGLATIAGSVMASSMRKNTRSLTSSSYTHHAPSGN